MTFILLLTTVTFKFVVNKSLPRISYLTYMVRNSFGSVTHALSQPPDLMSYDFVQRCSNSNHISFVIFLLFFVPFFSWLFLFVFISILLVCFLVHAEPLRVCCLQETTHPFCYSDIKKRQQSVCFLLRLENHKTTHRKQDDILCICCLFVVYFTTSKCCSFFLSATCYFFITSRQVNTQ